MGSTLSSSAVMRASDECAERLSSDEARLTELKVRAIADSIRRLLLAGAASVSVARLGNYQDANTCDEQVADHLGQLTTGLGTHGGCIALDAFGPLVADEHKHLFTSSLSR